MMDDKTLLTFAAKAGGYSHTEYIDGGLVWDPLTDDGDALRLAVKLGMRVEYNDISGNARAVNIKNSKTLAQCMTSLTTKDPYAATRRAVVRAAAEIGRRMP